MLTLLNRLFFFVVIQKKEKKRKQINYKVILKYLIESVTMKLLGLS